MLSGRSPSRAPAGQQSGGRPAGPSGTGYAVVDLEATGSSSRRHRVIELAVVLLDAELVPQGEFTTLVDPQGPVGPTHIHGIEARHLGGAPRFAGIAVRLLGLLRGRVLVGHNVGCDRAFLVAEFARIGLRPPSVPELCTMRMAAERGADRPPAYGLSLRACAAEIGITDWSPHTALGDARATAALFTAYAADGTSFAEELGIAAALRWPEPAGVLAAADALWVGRGNESPRRSVPNVRPGRA
ncbi:exonuclease domain-containing protein [Streptomyces polygonati]|uniref:Exonuclease domain-containing protein n=1 Tax=Streptomyces polygonati TaxID=1617087 RepID=A0ABV8HMH9_9ACTN